MHLSWSPRAFLLKGLLSDEECDHLIELVRGQRGKEQGRMVRASNLTRVSRSVSTLLVQC